MIVQLIVEWNVQQALQHMPGKMHKSSLVTASVASCTSEQRIWDVVKKCPKGSS